MIFRVNMIWFRGKKVLGLFVGREEILNTVPSLLGGEGTLFEPVRAVMVPDQLQTLSILALRYGSATELPSLTWQSGIMTVFVTVEGIARTEPSPNVMLITPTCELPKRLCV